jgi:hypothetical protein
MTVHIRKHEKVKDWAALRFGILTGGRHGISISMTFQAEGSGRI